MKLKDVDRNKLLIYLQYRYPISNYTLYSFDLNQGVSGLIEITTIESKWGFTDEYYEDVIEKVALIEREERINKLLTWN